MEFSCKQASAAVRPFYWTLPLSWKHGGRFIIKYLVGKYHFVRNNQITITVTLLKGYHIMCVDCNTLGVTRQDTRTPFGGCNRI